MRLLSSFFGYGLWAVPSLLSRGANAQCDSNDRCLSDMFPCDSPDELIVAQEFCAHVIEPSATFYPPRATDACGFEKSAYVSACACGPQPCDVPLTSSFTSTFAPKVSRTEDPPVLIETAPEVPSLTASITTTTTDISTFATGSTQTSFETSSSARSSSGPAPYHMESMPQPSTSTSSSSEINSLPPPPGKSTEESTSSTETQSSSETPPSSSETPPSSPSSSPPVSSETTPIESSSSITSSISTPSPSSSKISTSGSSSPETTPGLTPNFGRPPPNGRLPPPGDGDTSSADTTSSETDTPTSTPGSSESSSTEAVTSYSNTPRTSSTTPVLSTPPTSSTPPVSSAPSTSSEPPSSSTPPPSSDSSSSSVPPPSSSETSSTETQSSSVDVPPTPPPRPPPPAFAPPPPKTIETSSTGTWSSYSDVSSTSSPSSSELSSTSTGSSYSNIPPTSPTSSPSSAPPTSSIPPLSSVPPPPSTPPLSSSETPSTMSSTTDVPPNPPSFGRPPPPEIPPDEPSSAETVGSFSTPSVPPTTSSMTTPTGNTSQSYSASRSVPPYSVEIPTGYSLRPGPHTGSWNDSTSGPSLEPPFSVTGDAGIVTALQTATGDTASNLVPTGVSTAPRNSNGNPWTWTWSRRTRQTTEPRASPSGGDTTSPGPTISTEATSTAPSGATDQVSTGETSQVSITDGKGGGAAVTDPSTFTTITGNPSRNATDVVTGPPTKSNTDPAISKTSPAGAADTTTSAITGGPDPTPRPSRSIVTSVSEPPDPVASPSCTKGEDPGILDNAGFEGDGAEPWDFDSASPWTQSWGQAGTGANGTCRSFRVTLARSTDGTDEASRLWAARLRSPEYTVRPGRSWRLEFAVRFAEQNSARLSVVAGAAVDKPVATAIAWRDFAPDGGWKQIVADFTPDPAARTLEIQFWYLLDGALQNTIWIDTVNLAPAPVVVDPIAS